MKTEDICNKIKEAYDSHQSVIKSVLKPETQILLFSQNAIPDTPTQNMLEAYGAACLLSQGSDFIRERYIADDRQDCFDTEAVYSVSIDRSGEALSYVPCDYLIEVARRKDSKTTEHDLESMLASFFQEYNRTLINNEDIPSNLPSALVSSYARLFIHLKHMTVLRTVENSKTETLPIVNLLHNIILRSLPKTVTIVETNHMEYSGHLEFNNLFKFSKDHHFSDEDVEFIKMYNLEIKLECYIEKYEILRSCVFSFDQEKKEFVMFYTDRDQFYETGTTRREANTYLDARDINQQIEFIGKDLQSLTVE